MRTPRASTLSVIGRDVSAGAVAVPIGNDARGRPIAITEQKGYRAPPEFC